MDNEIDTNHEEFFLQNSITYSKYWTSFVEIIRNMSQGKITLQEKICNVGDIKVYRNLWLTIYQNISKHSTVPGFGHISTIAIGYFIKIAKYKYHELLRFSKKNNYTIKEVIDAFSAKIKMAYDEKFGVIQDEDDENEKKFSKAWIKRGAVRISDEITKAKDEGKYKLEKSATAIKITQDYKQLKKKFDSFFNKSYMSLNLAVAYSGTSYSNDLIKDYKITKVHAFPFS